MKLKDILLIILLTVIFTSLIFFIRSQFFGTREDLEIRMIEEKYIEPVSIIPQTFLSLEEEERRANLEEQLTLNSASPKITFTYIPKSFGEDNNLKVYRMIFDLFLNYEPIGSRFSFLEVVLQKEKIDVRGRMQDRKVKLFGIFEMRLSEFLAVGVHEFSHFYDLYVLVRKNGIDISDYFYDIAWEDTRIIKASLNQRDFVSGYAMTNKYEDFAESYTYYVFHNSDFFKRSRESNILMQKYDFFSKYIFPNNEFLDGLLYSASEPKNYYRDVTKISFSLENFLQYLKN